MAIRTTRASGIGSRPLHHVLFLLTLTAGLFGFSPEHVRAQVEVGQWDRFEASVTNRTRYDDPYNDVTLNVVYTRPDGSEVEFWGFYDGGSTWRIRFMPDRLGTWTYSASFSDGRPGISGSFRCVRSGIPA